MADSNDEIRRGGGGRRISLERFIDRDADTLFGVFEFGKLVGTGIRALVAVVFAAFVGIFVSISTAFQWLLDTVSRAITGVTFEATLGQLRANQKALREAGASIESFGLFATPIGVLTALSVVAVIAFAVNFVFGE